MNESKRSGGFSGGQIIFAGAVSVAIGIFVAVQVAGDHNATSPAGRRTYSQLAEPTATSATTTSVLDALACFEWKFEDPVQQREQVRIGLLRLRSAAGSSGPPTAGLIEQLYQAVYVSCGDGSDVRVGSLLSAVVVQNPTTYL